VTRALVGGRVEVSIDGRTLGALVAAGVAAELDYLPPSERARAEALGEELVLDALAGVDPRARLVGLACSDS
jgi:hypothetical protein